MASASDILFKIGADVDEFKKAIADAKKQTTGLGKDFDAFAEKTSNISAVFSSFGKTLTLGLSVPFAAAATGAVALASKAGNAADHLLDLEQITGLSTDRLQELQYVSADAGVEFDGLVDTMSKFSQKLVEIRSGTGGASDSMKALGVNIYDSAGNVRNADELFVDMVHSLQNVSNVTERNALAQKVFGESLKNVAPVLGYTNAQFDALLQSAHDAGVVLAKDDLVAANNFRLEMDKLKLSFDKSTNALGTALIPIISGPLVSAVDSATEAITAFREWWGGLEESTQDSLVTFGAIVAAIGPAAVVIGKLVAAFQTIATVVGAVKLAFAGQALATGAGTAAMVAHKIAAIAATVATKALNVVLMMNPAIAALAAVTALAAGLLYLANRTDKQTEAEKRAEAQKNALRTATLGLTEASQKQLDITQNITAAWERQGVSISQQIKNLQKNNNELVTDVKRGFGELGRLSEEQLKKYQDQIAANNSEIRRLQQQQEQETTNRRKTVNAQQIKDYEEAQKKYGEMIEKYGKSELQLREMQYDQDMADLNSAHSRNLISQEQFEKAKLIIIEQYAADAADIQKKTLADVINDISDGLDTFGGVVNDIGSIIDGFYENELERIDQQTEKRLESLDEWKEAQLEQYDAEEETELEKQERQLAELEAMLASSTNAKDQAALREAITEKKKSVNKLKIESEYDKKKAKIEADADKRTREIKREQAKTDKAIGIFNVAIQTAMAVMQALANMAPPASYVMAAISLAMGIAEAAVIAAEPLPLAQGAIAKATAGGKDVKLAEVGYDEAILPLTPAIFERIGDGIISALSRKISQIRGYAAGGSSAGEKQIVVEQHITVQGADVTIDSEKIGSVGTRMFRNRLILVDSGAIV